VSTMQDLLSARLTAAFSQLAGAPADPILRPSSRADFQANGVLALARSLGQDPVELAGRIVELAELEAIATATISGPGFINLTIKPGALDRLIERMAASDRLAVERAASPERVVIDYSAPNVAKEMHVGHLRSAIIGDSLVRVLRFVGHEVIGVSHIGDWGTPFGMLLERLIELGSDAGELTVGDLDGFYKSARARFDGDPAFAERSRQRVVLLQSGEPETLRLWRLLVAESQRHFLRVNERLGLKLSEEDFVGESFYNDRLAPTVSELDSRGLLLPSQGAQCVFPPGFTGRDGSPLPLIVRKSDGGYGYAATDLAAIWYRIKVLKATRLLYVIGSPQSTHLEMVFAVARQAGWLSDPVRAQHVAFGSILGGDGKMLKSRSGEPVKLIGLLDEAVANADTAAIGIGAVKYADLSSNRLKDYVYDPVAMLNKAGDTSVYLQYAHARVSSILAKVDGTGAGDVTISAPQERALALELLAFPGIVHTVAETLEPHRLTGYLRNLAVAFTGFVEACPVLRSTGDARRTRLVLCDLTARVLKQGLDLLGIEAPQRM
jgi:arginyl-tRNA synthetase